MGVRVRVIVWVLDYVAIIGCVCVWWGVRVWVREMACAHARGSACGVRVWVRETGGLGSDARACRRVRLYERLGCGCALCALWVCGCLCVYVWVCGCVSVLVCRCVGV